MLEPGGVDQINLTAHVFRKFVLINISFSIPAHEINKYKLFFLK